MDTNRVTSPFLDRWGKPCDHERPLHWSKECVVPDCPGKVYPEGLTQAEVEAMVLAVVDAAEWFYKMVATGGPDGTDLDQAVADQLRQALASLPERGTE